MRIARYFAPLLCAATPGLADPLPEMAGAWQGDGMARQTPASEPEIVRCRLDNAYDAARARLRVRGVCAVPGRRFEIDGALAADPDGSVRGFWSNPDGPGETAVAGRVDGPAVYFTFRARDPDTGGDVSQIVTWRLDGDTLSFRATDRATDGPMADVTFAR
ncbi:hypothetical protein [Jannaschia donghaensis]|uniref:DUF1579 domain-containing protein n=1 Tax=Jannaschia donghaensis TaxID=420998 RepID=A0A0M6YM78_9RHOB|nr:hypothetical protein [Jannaschia donghaensis]CTQ51471.1 hypothetical protein JDO7802_03511 [Jannaschia donghaensis]